MIRIAVMNGTAVSARAGWQARPKQCTKYAQLGETVHISCGHSVVAVWREQLAANLRSTIGFIVTGGTISVSVVIFCIYRTNMLTIGHPI